MIPNKHLSFVLIATCSYNTIENGSGEWKQRDSVAKWDLSQEAIIEQSEWMITHPILGNLNIPI